MDKDTIIKEIQEQFKCSKETAKDIFEKGVQNGMIARRLNWNFIITFIIYLAVLFTGIWALYRILTQ